MANVGTSPVRMQFVVARAIDCTELAVEVFGTLVLLIVECRTRDIPFSVEKLVLFVQSNHWQKCHQLVFTQTFTMGTKY